MKDEDEKKKEKNEAVDNKMEGEERNKRGMKKKDEEKNENDEVKKKGEDKEKRTMIWITRTKRKRSRMRRQRTGNELATHFKTPVHTDGGNSTKSRNFL
jgi:hypothetical protein